MSEIVLRLVWFFVASCAIAYMVFLIAGHMIRNDAEALERTVLVRDDLGKGTHALSGMVPVPTTCSELTVASERVGEALYELRFTTWETPSVKCVAEEVPRAFHIVVFAPSAGVKFIGTIDGTPLPLVVVPYIQ